MLVELSEFDKTPLPTLLQEKGIAEWDYADALKDEYDGFVLFIRPHAPFPVANGSYVILDYVDFALNTSFTIYYNVYRDEFFGESRIGGVPTVTYDFDANTVPRLELT